MSSINYYKETPFGDYSFYVMIKTSEGWKKISQDYTVLSDAQAALERLRSNHPEAPLGESKHIF